MMREDDADHGSHVSPMPQQIPAVKGARLDSHCIRQAAMPAATIHGPSAKSCASGCHIVNAHTLAEAWKSMAATTLPRAWIMISVITIDHAINSRANGRNPVPYCGVPLMMKSGRCQHAHAIPRISVPTIGPKRPSNRGRAKPRLPVPHLGPQLVGQARALSQFAAGGEKTNREESGSRRTPRHV